MRLLIEAMRSILFVECMTSGGSVPTGSHEKLCCGKGKR